MCRLSIVVISKINEEVTSDMFRQRSELDDRHRKDNNESFGVKYDQ